MTTNFELKEFIRTSHKVDNTPTKEVIDNIYRLATQILQPIRDKWGKPIIITSGYRCAELNKIVGGVKTSDHLTGNAADIKSDDNKVLFNLIVDMVNNGEINVGQLIDEHNYSWLHISNRGKHNNQILHIK